MAHEHVAGHEHGTHEAHPDSYYIKIWVVLLVLLVISILGPMLEHPVITLVTAFGIAFVKAGIVCVYFMHLSIEKKIVNYMLVASIGIMVVMFAGVSPDILKSEGTNWKWEKLNIVPVPIEHHGATHATAQHGTVKNAEEATLPAAPH